MSLNGSRRPYSNGYNNKKPKIVIDEMQLLISRVKIKRELQQAHEAVLLKSPAVYPVTNMEVFNFDIAGGQQTARIANAFFGRKPERINCGFLKDNILKGDIHEPTFFFHHTSLVSMSCTFNGLEVTGYRLDTDYSFFNDQSGRTSILPLFQLYLNTRNISYNPTFKINREQYNTQGVNLYCFDFSRDPGGPVSTPETGNVAFEFKFGSALKHQNLNGDVEPMPINFLILGEFHKDIRITSDRRVTAIDY